MMRDTSIDRRDFLAAGVGIAAAALPLHRPVLGANDRIGLGLIGCGVRGTYLFQEALAAAPGRLQVVAACDVWTPAREKFAGLIADKLPGQRPRLVSRYQELLGTPGLDA